jgi:hypothetical protein
MAIQRYERTPPWDSFEVVLRGTDGKLDPKQKPFSNSLTAGDGDPTHRAVQTMWLVQYHGWPKAKRVLKDGQGKPLIDRADDEKPAIWILKCKPSCWRLYFRVYEEAHQIVYLRNLSTTLRHSLREFTEQRP